MTDAAKEARRAYHREYYRQWAKANREKVRIYQERYWEKRAAEAETRKDPKNDRHEI